jgi:nitrogen fixation protein
MAETLSVDHFNLAGAKVNLKNGFVTATMDLKLLSVLSLAVEKPDIRTLRRR